MPVLLLQSSLPAAGTAGIKPVPPDSAASSLFSENLLQPDHQEALPHQQEYDYITALILFFSFALFVWLYVTNRKRLSQIIRAFYISRFANQLAREEVSFGNRVSLFLSSLFILTLTLFLSQVNDYFGFFSFESDILSMMAIAGMLVFAYLLKMAVIRFLGFIFLVQREASEYTTSIFLFGNTLGLFMMPVVILLAFAKEISPLVFIYTGLGILISFLCVRLIRGLIIGINSLRVSGFYLFLYLCTLEILPFVILVKLFLLKAK